MVQLLNCRWSSLFFNALLFFSVIYSALAKVEDALDSGRDDEAEPEAPSLQNIMSEGTIRAILEDTQLRHTYMALVSMASATSREAAGRYGVSELTTLADDLDGHVRDVNANTDEPLHLPSRSKATVDDLHRRAGPFGGLFNGFLGGNNGGNRAAADGNAGSSQAQGGGGGGGGLLGNLLGGGGGGGGIGGLISSTVGKAFNGLLDQTGGRLAGAGFFGGVGAGAGAAQALSLAPAEMTKSTAKQVAQDNQMKNTGLNPIIQNAATGLTATAVKAFMGSNVVQLPPVGGLGVSLGTGIGNGAAVGLGLTQKNLGPPTNGSAFEDAIGGFGFGASQSLTSSLNGRAGGLASFLPPIDLGATVADVGSGIGKGAALGLRLTNNTGIAPPQPTSASDIPGLAGTLAFGLSQGLTGSIDTQGLGSLVPANLDIGGAALSVGAGLGNGAAKGLKLTQRNIEPPVAQSAQDIPGIAGSLAFGLSNSLTDNINLSANSLASMLPPIDFGATALDIGSGLGKGAAVGLKLVQNDTDGFPVPPPGASADIPKIAGSLAFGLSRSLSESVNTSSVGLGNILPADLDIGSAVLRAGRGLGSGASLGLGLASDQNFTPPAVTSQSDIPGIAEAFTFGLSNSLTDKVNLSSQVGSLGSMLPPIDIGATALSTGAGLGLGTAKGLGLSNKALAPASPASVNDIPNIAGNLAFGLSDAVSGSLNTTDLLARFGGGAGDLLKGGVNGLVSKFGAPAASGLGRGLGKGAAIGLGLQPEGSPEPLESAAAGDVDIAGITQNFAEGLSSRFLANGTIDKLTAGLTEATGGGLGSLTSSIDIPRLANGFTRGLVTGAGDGVEAIGGIDAILAGQSKPPAGTVPDSKIEFNDSAGGAAVGFGQGLGSSGVVTLQKLLARGINLGAILPESPKQRRDIEPPTKALSLVGREDDVVSGLDLSRFLTASSISTVAQKGVDLLTCDGVAGLLLIGLGLQNSGTVSINGGTSGNVQNILNAVIPNGTIRVVSEGNTFDIDGQKLTKALQSGSGLLQTLSINGFGLAAYTAFVTLHVGSAILGYMFLMPMVLSLTSIGNIFNRLRVPDMLPAWTPKFCKMTVIFGVIPSSILLLIFGIVAGASKHFRTAHGILGLITTFVSIIAILLYFYSKPEVLTPGEPIPGNNQTTRLTMASKIVNQLLWVLLVPTVITGFADLSSVTLCLTRAVVRFEIAVTLGLALGSMFVMSQFITSSELILLYRTRSKANKAFSASREKEQRLDAARQDQWNRFDRI
ncbi:hypothetical protein NOR_05237 [Metarhizium rileyi]|uniref:Uncharacterized protein n=1 Tax=Metarhizium rileyi (strain RCEF 4871) TaxID=1649241 RepID=A0A167CYE5_METRR|nr:hypothetical protein NOR_05237 [Metarhizium rileyi RCEF 4871]